MFNHQAFIARHKLPDAARLDINTKRGFMGDPKIDDAERIVSGMITTTDVGIDGLIVPGSAFDMSYFWGDGSGPIRSVYYNHDYNALPVGRCVNLIGKDGGLWCRTFIARNEIGNDLLVLIRDSIISGFSTGFRTIEQSEPTDDEIGRWNITEPDAIVVRKALLLEYSIVSMPACPTAVIDQLLTRSAISRKGAAFFGLPITAERKYHPTTEPTIIEDEPATIIDV